jgi:transcription termination factor Rho
MPVELDPLYTQGVLTIGKDRKAYLRDPGVCYVPGPEDLFVPQSLIQRYGLAAGAVIEGEAQTEEPQTNGSDGTDRERDRDDRDGPSGNRRRRNRRRRRRKKSGPNTALGTVTRVCGLKPEIFKDRIPFDKLTVIDPERKIDLTSGTDDTSLRIIDMMSPIGFGQRGLIVSPPRSGKTILLQKLAGAVQRNHPEAYLIVLLVDERPEEVTDFRRKVRGEIAASSNDQPASMHANLVEVVLQKARRLVEAGRDVVVFMDSLTRLGRAYNLLQKGPGRTMSGGIDARTLEKPKAFFGAARNCEEGGSLTIIATALIDTGSRMDQVIFEEFKGTGNMELVLNRDLANRRIWPAIDVNQSGTRKEEKLIPEDYLDRTYLLRRALDRLNAQEAVTLLIEKLKKTDTNEEFLDQLNIDL